MTLPTYTWPDFTAQLGSAWKTNVDHAFLVFERVGAWFAPHEQDQGSPQPDMSIRVDAGFVFDGDTLTEVASQTVSGFTTPSSSAVRIDRVVVDASTGVASRIAGTEALGSPSAVAPDIPAGKLPICQITFTDADAVITNAMITDERVFPL